jgi:hypothetical protein
LILLDHFTFQQLTNFGKPTPSNNFGKPTLSNNFDDFTFQQFSNFGTLASWIYL